ncbi:MAG: hypothetical protein A2X28_01595 [Elusimicrobia bacterium GWA2_56_46]|nr:MAG: hypothetical protein A2X28_01595 [Elusimicrobia bacterium GWA2_56_46]OGR53851.1 MAG: hypothetical protein A2X39_06995 [Elusimicrobia bacterium GWC2_56_31]HBB68322.1 hypothetical protein [Elusimicrobiota bacterium]HBW22703.1 hypothetical protein [Elusimicrobiota bacterium]
MKKTISAALLLTAVLSAPAAAQIMQVIPAPSTSTLEGLMLSTSSLFQPPQKAAKPGLPSKPAQYGETKAPLSGIVLMPTAYRGRGKNSIGLGLDFNAAYYIGRLYGKNKYDWTVEKTNYLDRVGLWMLSADTKMLVQTEGRWRPAVASGVQGIFQFRDAPQPPINGTFNLTIKATGKKTASYANAYVVLTKRVHPKFILNAGYSDGDMPKVLYQLSEFLSKQAMSLNGVTDPSIPAGMLFGGLMWLPKPDSPIGVEVMIPQGAPMNPKLFNFHLGTLLKLNFEISYLTFKGGWDALGMFQFRYGYFPK